MKKYDETTNSINIDNSSDLKMVLAWLNQTDQKVLRFNGIVTYSIKAFAVYVSMVFSELVFSLHASVIFSYQLCGGLSKYL